MNLPGVIVSLKFGACLSLSLSNMRVIKCTNRHIYSSSSNAWEENYSLHLSECLDASSYRICMLWIRADVWLIELMPSSSSTSIDSTACRSTSGIISTNASAATKYPNRKRWYLADDKSSSIHLSSFLLINLRRRFPHRLFSHLSIGTRSIYPRRSTLFFCYPGINRLVDIYFFRRLWLSAGLDKSKITSQTEFSLNWYDEHPSVYSVSLRKQSQCSDNLRIVNCVDLNCKGSFMSLTFALLPRSKTNNIIERRHREQRWSCTTWARQEKYATFDWRDQRY